MRFNVEGVISAMVTPFTQGGTYVDFDKVGPLASLIVRRGASGLFVCGTTGEGMLMSPEERKETLEEVIQAVGKKAKVIAHTGCLELASTIELTQHAQEVGAYAAGAVTPAFYSYDDRSLIQYYKALAKAVPDFPILLYNIPGCAKNSLSPELVLRLAESTENIVGLKDSAGDLPSLIEILENAPKGFQVINGVDDYGLQAILSGVKAAVSGTSSVTIELYCRIFDLASKGKLKAAAKAQAKLTKSAKALEYGVKTAVFKEGLRLQGFDAGYVRPPQRELTAAEKRALAKTLKELGFI